MFRRRRGGRADRRAVNLPGQPRDLPPGKLADLPHSLRKFLRESADADQHLHGPQRLEGVLESLPFPPRADEQQQKLVVLHSERCPRRFSVPALKARHVHAIAHEMNPFGRQREVRQDFFSDHLRVDNDAAGVMS